MQRLASLYIAETTNRGRGVFTAEALHAGDVIEVCPVIIIPKENCPSSTKLYYTITIFCGAKKLDDCAIALGYGSLYNHELHPNANFILDLENLTIDIEAIRDIEAGEEITLNYHGEPGDESELWF